MKKLLLLFSLLLTGCTSSTQYGECIGAFADQNPKLEYKLSARNTVVAIVFFELLAPPILVLANETLCPVGVK